MRKEEIAKCTELLNELQVLNDTGRLGESVTPESLMALLSPEARTQWNRLLDALEPSPVAEAAGYTSFDLLYYALQKELITRGAGSEEEANERISLYNQIAMLGQGKDIDLYDQRVRKIRCISRGYRFDRKDMWETIMNTGAAFAEKLRKDNIAVPESYEEETLNYLMDEPEAEQLVIGETYTLLATVPDIPFNNGRNSHLCLVFLEEIHSAPKAFIDYPDGGFHSHLFEELEEVSLADRVKHHDEYYDDDENFDDDKE